ncbi:hypothetical protein J3A83DRAFT_4229579 [Scleroderma citrinum]
MTDEAKDPLDLLLHDSDDSELSQAATPPDWSQFTSLWHPQDAKPQDPASAFDLSFLMDMDFSYAPSMAMAVDPSMLYLDAKGIQLGAEDASAIPIRPQDILADSSLSSADESSSPGSPSSRTGGSPVVSHAPTNMTGSIAPSFIPAPPMVSAVNPPQSHPLSVSSTPNSSPPRPTENTHPSSNTSLGRPKTSHTTIERRYRTNLNARIQSLKAAVPALRVLDSNIQNDEYAVDERGYIDGVKVARKGSKANVLGKAVEYIQVLKRREARLKREKEGLRTVICRFPGGVDILTEWESEWTKKYGGPERDEIDNAGIDEASDDEDGDDDDDGSERARKKPKIDSAPQKKEKRKTVPAVPITVNGTAGSIPGAVPEKRKRGRPRKIQPNATPPVIAAGTPVVVAGPNAALQGQAVLQMTTQHSQPQQYLLAVFALFSFFNSPFTSTSTKQHYTHEGTVLGHVSHTASTSSWAWNDVVQAIHLLASTLVLISIVVPWIPFPDKLSQSRILKLVPFTSTIYQTGASVTSKHSMPDLPTPPVSPQASDSDSDSGSSSNETVRADDHTRASSGESSPLFLALSSKGSKDEYEKLIDALHVSPGFIGLIRGAVGLPSGRVSEPRLQHEAWMRIAEIIVLRSQDAEASMGLRWQVYNHLSSSLCTSVRVAPTTTLASNLCTLALLAHTLPFSQARAEGLWSRARGMVNPGLDGAFTFERLVFEEMTLADAVQRLSSILLSKHTRMLSPITLLASALVRRRLCAHASTLFIHRATQGQQGEVEEFPVTEEAKQWRETIGYGCSLGGTVAMLCNMFQRVWVGNDVDLDIDMDALDCDPTDAGAQALLTAIILHNRVFPSRRTCGEIPGYSSGFAVSILSPPPSPPRPTPAGQPKDLVLQLRCALGSSVFEQSANNTPLDGLSLEDARDRVVDQLVNLERERRSRTVL